MALSGAQWFLIEGGKKGKEDLVFWDEHSLDKQRYFDISCLVYGHDTDAFQHLVGSKGLPRPRARRCPNEYARIEASWRKLLTPHIKADEEETSEAPAKAAKRPAQQAPEPPKAPTCTVLAEHIMSTLFAAYVASLSPEERAEIEAQPEAKQLMRAEAVEICRKTPWTDEQRLCVLAARTLDAADACDID